MVDSKIIHQQLKKIKFGGSPWNQAELRELPKIIHEGEEISECVNGFYEGGVALLVATEMRLLLIDKKPMRFLTVEDFRFDMINEIDYSHRLLNATVTVSTGSKTLKFTSINQARLRHLISLVQEHMSNSKKDQTEKAESQQQHLQEINKQLQMYLMAQHQQLQQQLLSGGKSEAIQLPKPDPQLSDYLFAQRLLEKFQHENGPLPATQTAVTANPVAESSRPLLEAVTQPAADTTDLVADAKREVFGGHIDAAPATTPSATQAADNPASFFSGIEVSPLRIAYSKLPMMLRNRKFGRPSLRAHSQEEIPTGQTAAQ